MYIQKPSPFWWTSNIRYFIYFLREFTGVLIAFYTIFFLTKAVLDPALLFTKSPSFRAISWIGLAAAVFHTITWFWVTVKISPVQLKKPMQILFFVALIAIWLAISYFLFHFFYVQ